MKSWNILIAGVGGQGTLLASRILGALALACGYDVKVSEVHGMAQRGGSVLTYVRMGDKVHSPVIEPGGADVLLAFEQLEALRYAHYVRTGGYILFNTQRILPMPVISGKQPYPEDIASNLGGFGVKAIEADALCMAQKAGNEKAVNTVMLGMLSSIMGFDDSLWMDAFKKCIPEKLLAVNAKAFMEGKRL
jgi:indolepyruvate ferredoxin oxidoreductase, beta subunit